jgi:alpha(1,3/1,4) fucosyltransferase
VKISFIPFYNSQLNNYLFQKSNERDNNLEPYTKLKNYFESKNYTLNTVDITPIKDADYIIFFDLNLKYILQAYFSGKLHKSIYVPFEPPVVSYLHKSENLKWISNLFGRVLTWQDDLVDNKKFFKFHPPMSAQSFKYENIDFKDKNYITTIVGYKKSNKKNELYSKRIEAIRYFENKYSDFDFFGVGWSKNEYKSYKGKVASKYEILKNYKFAICYENESDIKGLISEKIFDCFYARTIPIFWGASNVAEYFPKETFIDKREFKTYRTLDSYISNMSEDDYNYRILAIETYLLSDEFKKFSSDSFSRTIYDHLINEKKKEKNSFYQYYFRLFFIKSFFQLLKELKFLIKSMLNLRKKYAS